MNTKNLLFGSIILLVVGLLLGIFTGYLIFKPKKPTIGLPKYFPVVVTVPKYISKPEPYGIVIPSHIEYRYLSYEDSARLVGVIDSLIVLVGKDPKHDTLKIKPKFLTTFPTAPKLIDLDLSMDSLSLTLLNTEASLFTKRYPLNLFEYRYRFNGYSMSVDPLTNKWGMPSVSKWRMSLSSSLGTDMIDYPRLQPFISVEGELSYSRVRLLLEPKVTISKVPQLGMDVKLGVTLWEWPKSK